MTMNDFLFLVQAAVAGLLLGAIFFGGLLVTVRKGLASNAPALWFSVSLGLRMSIALAGFYFVSDGRWERAALCLSGFVVARVVVARLAGLFDRKVHHAP
jgi:F1F0 ATPase subunit 2